MRVVLDTNVLLTSLGRRSPTRPIFDALLSQRLTLVVSTGILLEYEEILAQRNGPAVAYNVLEALVNLRNISRQETRYNWRLPFIDPDDQNSWTPTSLATPTTSSATTGTLLAWAPRGFRRCELWRRRHFWNH